MKFQHLLAACLAVFALPDVQAQSAQTVPPDPAVVSEPPCCRAAAGSIVELELSEPVSSKDRKPGDFFGMRLHSALVVDGNVLLPAGTPAVGQVVHADRARGGGKPGELILAARYVDASTARLALHAMKLDATGKDRSMTSLALATGIGVFAQFVHGGEIAIPAGTVATAKLSNDLQAAPIAVVAADPPAQTPAAHLDPSATPPKE